MQHNHNNTKLIAYAFVLLVLTILIFLSFVEVDRVISGRGKTILLEPKIIIRPVTRSTIQSINVQVGELVNKGQTLLVLDSTVPESEYTKQAERAASYQSEIARLERMLNPNPNSKSHQYPLDDAIQGSMLVAERAQYAERLKSLQEAERSLSAKVSEFKAQIPLLQEQVKIAAQVEAMWDELVNKENYGSKLNWYKATQDRIRLESQLSDTRRELKSAMHDRAKAAAEIEGFVKEWQVKKIDEKIKAERSYREAQQDTKKAGFESNSVIITAPNEGIVTEMSDNAAGTLVSQTDILMKIVPAQTPRFADIRINANDISYVSPGMPVDIKLDSAPFQKHGDMQGVVQSLSYDSFDAKIDGSGQSNREISTNVSKSSQDNEQFYLARVKITESRLHSLPQSFKLLPGMTLTGDVKIGTRKLYEYLLFPVVRAMREGGREP
jgi:hemolysin D